MAYCQKNKKGITPSTDEKIWSELWKYFLQKSLCNLWPTIMIVSNETKKSAFYPQYVSKQQVIKNKAFCAGWCGSVDWVPSCKPKGCQINALNAQTGHMPELWARSLMEDISEANTFMFLCLPFFLLSPMSKNK